MRAIVGIALLVLVLALIGWISFDSSDERPGVNLETDKIEQDVDALSESVKQAGETFEREVQEKREEGVE
ncbi:hypothetical protein Pla123a_46180 [Posidoniimonas polymericola]|uniref:Uncharacterized protein n=1 Tax=Posidoniimonas polymericola TaxID=2528002 RepID=A0A5C5XV31_9BACT|nr:hypothetical protein [Posidoniimonas polymericola]TWT66730.1 hypothetical protein Pla123a_46180 [Posidoniimonas polymericola]